MDDQGSNFGRLNIPANDSDETILQNWVKNQTRKRTRNPQQHKEFKRKCLVQKGEEHTSKSGNVIKKKEFKVLETCSCSRNCYQIIDAARQRDIYNIYYKFENWSKKCLFLRSLITSRPCKDNLNPIAKKNLYKHTYHLKDKNGTTHTVCQKFIIQCLQISKSCLNRAIHSIVSNTNAVEHRGHCANRKTNSNDMEFLCNFIQRLPSYNSHYASARSSVRYLNPALNIVRLYREYSLVCRLHGRNTLSQWVFSNTFNTKFNLRFAKRKIDTCTKCDELQSLIRSTTGTQQLALKALKDDHLAMVNKYKLFFSEIVESAKKQNSKIEIRTFDLQKALELPCISTSEAYYKRQLWVYNLCIYDEVRGIAYMHVWPETIASRGSDEISSCLYKHFYKTIPQDTERIILYSDSCGGQNKNIIMSLMIKYFLNYWPHRNLKTIDQRFFVKGHSYNSCDRCFGLIEKQKKITEDIFIPMHWINLIEQAKKKNPKFIVSEMRKENFLSFKQLKSLIVNRKRSTDGRKISWFKLENIIYERKAPFTLKVHEYNLDTSPMIKISIKKKYVNEFPNVNFPLLYSNGRKISFKKYHDLQELIKYIPAQYQSFFRKLKHKTTNGESDEEE